MSVDVEGRDAHLCETGIDSTQVYHGRLLDVRLGLLLFALLHVGFTLDALQTLKLGACTDDMVS